MITRIGHQPLQRQRVLLRSPAGVQRERMGEQHRRAAQARSSRRRCRGSASADRSGATRRSFSSTASGCSAEQNTEIDPDRLHGSRAAGHLALLNGGRNQPSGVAGASVDANGNPVVPIGTYNVAGATIRRDSASIRRFSRLIGHDAAAEQLHRRRRPEHGRLHVLRARRGKADGLRDQGRSHVQRAATARSSGIRRATRTRSATR